MCFNKPSFRPQLSVHSFFTLPGRSQFRFEPDFFFFYRILSCPKYTSGSTDHTSKHLCHQATKPQSQIIRFSGRQAPLRTQPSLASLSLFVFLNAKAATALCISSPRGNRKESQRLPACTAQTPAGAFPKATGTVPPSQGTQVRRLPPEGAQKAAL